MNKFSKVENFWVKSAYLKCGFIANVKDQIFRDAIYI